MAHGNAIRRDARPLKIAGVSTLKGIRWFVFAARPDQPPQNLQLGAEVNARGEFTLEHLSPGEYDLRVAAMGDLEPKIRNSIFSFKERIVVNGNNPPITVTVDLSRKE